MRNPRLVITPGTTVSSFEGMVVLHFENEELADNFLNFLAWLDEQTEPVTLVLTPEPQGVIELSASEKVN